MTSSDLLRLIPCYVAGDLDPELAAEIEGEMRKDPRLDALARDLAAEHERALATLRAAPPLTLEARLSEVPPAAGSAQRATTSRKRRQPPWFRALALGVGLAVTAAGVAVTATLWTSPSAQVAADPRLQPLLDAHAAAADRGAWLAATDLAAAEAAGVPAALRVVPDLTELGLHTDGLVVLPGTPPGLAVVYSVGTERIVCQMWEGVGALGPATRTVTLGGVTVRGYATDQAALTVFQLGDMVCVMSTTDKDLDALIALTERRLRLM